MRHHVMVRGVRRGLIFVDDVDRRRFLTTLERVLLDARMECDAWALMPNHAHLEPETPPGGSLTRVMHALLTSYAVYFNRRHKGSGYVFQGRFLSKPVTTEGGWLRVLRYIHLNPYDAGIVSSLDELASYPWTGHSVLMGNRRFAPQRADFVLQQFARDRGAARRNLCAWMGMGLDDRGRLLPLSDDAGEIVEAMSGPGLSEWHWMPRPTLDGLEEMVSLATGISRAIIRGRSRRHEVVRARSLLIHLALDVLGLRSVEVAQCMGVTPGAVTHAARRGRAIARELFSAGPDMSPAGMTRRPVEQWLRASGVSAGALSSQRSVASHPRGQ